MIDAMAGRGVSTCEIPGDLIKTDYGKGDIHISIEGAVVTLLKDINPAYNKYFIYPYIRGRKCTYAESKNTTYDTLEASLLFRTKLSKSREKMG